MRTIWQSLAWKEWHEHKWKLASLTAIVVGVSSIGYYDRTVFGVTALIAIFCIAPLAVFVGAGEATGERARGTLAFTQALPVPKWKIALIKLVAGALTSTVPLLINLAVIVLLYFLYQFALVEPAARLTFPMARDFGAMSLSKWLCLNAMAGILVTLSLFLWAAVIGVRCKDEISASAWTLLTIVVWWTTVVMVPTVFDWQLGPSEEWFMPLVAAVSPGGWLPYMSAADDYNLSLWSTLTVAISVQLGFAAIFLRRFGTTEGQEDRARQTASLARCQTDWLAPPRTSRLAAIIWKQCRESGPIALAGLAGIVFTALLIYIAEPQAYDLEAIGLVVAGVAAYFGMLVTLVVAIGLFLSDLKPQLHTFWRSRPISPERLFWTKYATGLAVLALAFAIPFSFAAIVSGIEHPDFDDLAIWAVLVPIWIYSAAIMMTCLVRQAIYAAVLSCAAMYLGFLFVVGISRLVKLGAGLIPWDEWNDPTTGEMAAAMVLASIAFTIIAWLAVRNDWGRTSRY